MKKETVSCTLTPLNEPVIGKEWLLYLQQFKQLIVGFSGGLDSTVLLHLLCAEPTLRPRIRAVYINHGLSEHALRWQQHCEQFCLEHHSAFLARAVTFNRRANIEEGARIARYAVFGELLGSQDCLLLGHHQNDQAETVLLQLMRGAGVSGLAAMSPMSSFFAGMLVRPLLSCSREQLSEYAGIHQLQWIEDESNQDSDYSRNYIRQHIMPLLNAKWPGATQNIARAARHCQSAQRNLSELALYDCSELEFGATNTLMTTSLHRLGVDRQMNVLRAWLKKNNVKAPSTVLLERIINEVINSTASANPLVQWSTVSVRRYQDTLYLEQQQSQTMPALMQWMDFPQPLVLTHQYQLRASSVEQGLYLAYGAQLTIRFRQGGERFQFRGQNKSLKKLLQQWQIPSWLRDEIPLLYVDDKLAAVIGYAISDSFYTQNAPAWEIELHSNLSLCEE